MTRMHITAAKLGNILPCVGKLLPQQRLSPPSGGGHRTPRRDGPRSWVVAVAAFASMFFSIGLSFGTVGVMTVAIGERFKGASRSDLSWIGGLRMLFTFCTGIASSALHSRIGSRRLQIIGSIIVCIATGLSSLSTELWHMYVTFGALAGVGLSMVFTSASVAVDGLFERYLHVALPLAQLGGAVGMSVFPASARAVVRALGFRGSLYVLCGLSFAPVLWALLYADAARRREDGSDASSAGENAMKKDAVSDAAIRAANLATCIARNAAVAAKEAVKAKTSLSLSTQTTYLLAQALHRSLIADDVDRLCEAAERHTTKGTRHSTAVADKLECAVSTQSEPHEGRDETDGICCEAHSPIRVIPSDHIASSSGAAVASGDASMTQLNEPLPSSDSLAFRKAEAGARASNSLSTNGAAIAGRDASEQRTDKPSSASAIAPSPQFSSPSSMAIDDGSEAPLWRRMQRLLASGDTWLGLLHFFCRQYSSSAIVVLLPTLATSARRLPAEAGTISLTVLFAATVPGLVTTVALGARAYNRMLLAVMACVMLGAATMASAPALASIGSFYPICAFSGYWLGMTLGMFMSVVKLLCGAHARLADVFGLTAFASGLGGLAGPAVSGILLNIAEPEITLYVTGGVAILGGAALIAPAVRRSKSQPVGDAEQASMPEAEAAAAAQNEAAAPSVAAQSADECDTSSPA